MLPLDPGDRVARMLTRAAYHDACAQHYLPPRCDAPTAASSTLADDHERRAAQWRRLAQLLRRDAMAR